VRTILVDFDTDAGRDFNDIVPIGVLLERADGASFESLYTEAVTERGDSGFDNYVSTMEATSDFRDVWDSGGDSSQFPTVKDLFIYVADNSYLGLRFRAIGMVDDSATLQEVFDLYVVQQEPLPVISDEELSGE